MSKILWVLFQLFLTLLCSPRLFGDTYPLWGALQAGPYPIGFTARFEYDNSRVFHAKYDPDGKLYSGNRARPIQIAIWYPSAKPSANRMTYEQYAYLIAQELDFGPLTAAGKEEAVRQFQTQRQRFSGATDRGIETLLHSPTASIRDAVAARGKFPLIIYAPGSGGTTIENSILCEYLASHGYIVASLPSMGAYSRSATIDLTGFYAYMQDIEFVTGYMQHFPNVDPNALGIVGFSMGGSAAILVQMRSFEIDAVVYLDTGLAFDVVDIWFHPSNYYNPADLRAPQLYLVRKDARGLKLKQLEEAPFADRYVFLSPEGYRHPDFISDGMFGGLIDGYLPANTKNAKALFEYVTETTRDFLDAYVKREKPPLQALQARVKQNSLFAGSYTPAASSPPREFQIAEMVRDGKLDQVKQLTLKKYAGYPLFREATLNNLAYEYLFRGETARAIEIFEFNAQAFPQSANAQDSLSEAYDMAGDAEKSLAHANKAMEFLKADTRMDTTRKQLIQQAIEQRVQRLKHSEAKSGQSE